jgi:hypothetical protein
MLLTTARLRASNGAYVCAEGGGGSSLVANRQSGADWETFSIYGEQLPLVSGSTVHLRAYSGECWCAEDGGGREVNATRETAAGWETFTIVLADGSAGAINNGSGIALRASNGQYVCAEDGGGRELVANRNVIGPWETFALETVPAPSVIFDSTEWRRGDFHMRGEAYLTRDGQLRADITTWSTSWLLGFTGGAMVLVIDGDDNVIYSWLTHPLGVDATSIFWSRSSRTDHPTQQINPNLAQRATRIRIAFSHMGVNRWDRIRQQIDETVQTVATIIGLIGDLTNQEEGRQ